MADKVDIFRVSSQGTFDRRTSEIDGRFPGLYILPPREKNLLNSGAEQGRAYNANANSLVDLTNAKRLDTWEEVEEFMPDFSRRAPVRRWGCVVSDYSMNPVGVEEGHDKEQSAGVAMSQANQLGLLQSLAQASNEVKSKGWQPLVMRMLTLGILGWIIIWGVLLFQEQSVRNRVNQFGQNYQIFDNPVHGLTGGLLGGETAPADPAAPADGADTIVAPATSIDGPEPTPAPAEQPVAPTPTPPPTELPPKADEIGGSP